MFIEVQYELQWRADFPPVSVFSINVPFLHGSAWEHTDELADWFGCCTLFRRSGVSRSAAPVRSESKTESPSAPPRPCWTGTLLCAVNWQPCFFLSRHLLHAHFRARRRHHHVVATSKTNREPKIAKFDFHIFGGVNFAVKKINVLFKTQFCNNYMKSILFFFPNLAVIISL